MVELVRVDNPNVSIEGTAESMLVMYPIRPVKEGDGWGWEYTGGTPTEYDESAEQREEDGAVLFQDEDGEDVPIWNVGVKHANGRVTPLAPRTAVPPLTGAAAIGAKIAGYRRKTEEDEYTDVGDTWELFTELEDDLRRLAAETAPADGLLRELCAAVVALQEAEGAFRAWHDENPGASGGRFSEAAEKPARLAGELREVMARARVYLGPDPA